MLTDFSSLPDSLEAEELEDYFKEFLSVYSDKPKNLQALKELYELAYRQWDTYENLSPEIEKPLENYIMAAINFKSYDVTDVIISIVENLTMKNVFNYIINNKSQVSVPSIRSLIEDAEEEYADTILNPYGDMNDEF